MTTTKPRLRLSFRTRLGLIITGVFIAAGAGLLAVQYAIVQGLFAEAIQVTAVSCLERPIAVNYDGSVVTGCTLPSVPAQPIDVTMSADGLGYMEATQGAVLQQSAFLSQEVGNGLLFWSIVTLVVFAGIAAAIAFWLARRSLDRIGEVTAAARDITEHDFGRRLDLPGPNDEIKELGDTFDGMLDRLQLAFAAQDRFVANASHELRTPLTTTRTALEIPLAQGTVPADLEEPLRRALRATEQSERLITALLSLARGRVKAEEFDPVEFGDVVDSEIEELADEALARDITVTASIQGTSILGDVTLVSRAVRNLLDNAVRHNHEGGQIWVRLRGAVLEVESTGEQLDPERVAMLIEPFYRGDASRTVGEGVGLGLTIVDSIALTHEGKLDLMARKGGGLIATLTLG